MDDHATLLGQCEITNEDYSYSHHQSPNTVPMLLPETWEQVLLNLSSNDFHSAINTCPEWNCLMSSQKTALLFPLVLPILIDYLPLETILQLRKVSKKCTLEATNNLLKEHPGFRPPVNRRSLFHKLSSIDKYTFTSEKQIHEFISRVESRPFPEANPFLLGSLTIHLNGWVNAEILRRTKAFQQLFSLYGHHVEKVYLPQFQIDGRTLETFLTLLANAPNIKSINILGPVHMAEEFLEGLTFPKLEKLEGMYMYHGFQDVSLESGFLLRMLTQYGAQLKSLSMNNLLRSPNVSSTLLSLLAPNVTWFELATVNGAALRKLACVNWQLEELIIWGEEREGCTGSILLGFLEVVNNFAGTLINLKLICSDIERIQGLVSFERMAPLVKLNTFTIEFVNLRLGWIWEFLGRCCQNLKEVYLMTNASLTEDELQLAKRLFDSLPMLKRIVILPNFLMSGVLRRVILPPN
ncbi:unnamed protein product [Orchesella dallaii]|uniref:F-box domain-containing protein n=1 Tax=Orchesella dallaii TaxID=48710 RepID=A0ABP1S8K7_9HEXA